VEAEVHRARQEGDGTRARALLHEQEAATRRLESLKGLRYFPHEQGYRMRCGSHAGGLYLAAGELAVEQLLAAAHLTLRAGDDGQRCLSVELTALDPADEEDGATALLRATHVGTRHERTDMADTTEDLRCRVTFRFALEVRKQKTPRPMGGNTQKGWRTNNK
jgi:hypothetical protein